MDNISVKVVIVIQRKRSWKDILTIAESVRECGGSYDDSGRGVAVDIARLTREATEDAMARAAEYFDTASEKKACSEAKS